MPEHEPLPTAVRLISYDIIFEAMPASPSDWPAELAGQGDDLYMLAQSKPAAAITRLEALVQKYPDYPRLWNYLAAAHNCAGHEQQTRELTEESCRRFPDYLFAKLSWANMLLQERKTEEAATLLDHKFEISMHLGGRTRIHISEFLSFAMTVGWYFAQKGNRDAAERYLDMAHQLDPDAPQVRTLKHLIQTESLLVAAERVATMAVPRHRRRKK